MIKSMLITKKILLFFFLMGKGIKMFLCHFRGFIEKTINKGREESNGFEWKGFTFEISINIKNLY